MGPTNTADAADRINDYVHVRAPPFPGRSDPYGKKIRSGGRLAYPVRLSHVSRTVRAILLYIETDIHRLKWESLFHLLRALSITIAHIRLYIAPIFRIRDVQQACGVHRPHFDKTLATSNDVERQVFRSPGLLLALTNPSLIIAITLVTTIGGS